MIHARQSFASYFAFAIDSILKVVCREGYARGPQELVRLTLNRVGRLGLRFNALVEEWRAGTLRAAVGEKVTPHPGFGPLRGPNPQGEEDSRAPPHESVPGVIATVSADALSAWQRALIAWLDAHRAYPEAARRVGEQGAVGVRFTLSESGDVTGADIQRGSGSMVLDDATLAMLRGAHLPPPPPGTDAARRTISVLIRYQLN